MIHPRLFLLTSFLSVLLLVHPIDAFIVQPSSRTSTCITKSSNQKLNASGFDGDSSGSPVDAFLDDLKVRFRIFQESNASGSGFKQTVANVIAGEYDEEGVQNEVEELINSAPCVMFTWEKSPSCVKAIDAFDMMGVDYKVVRLDDPWSTGNPIRAELGKKFGRTSVPFIFIDGKYVGGYDGGLEDNEGAPGIVAMSFKGTLRSSLANVGSLKQE